MWNGLRQFPGRVPTIDEVSAGLRLSPALCHGRSESAAVEDPGARDVATGHKWCGVTFAERGRA